MKLHLVTSRGTKDNQLDWTPKDSPGYDPSLK